MARMARLLSRRAKRGAPVGIRNAMDHITYEMPVSPGLRGNGSCAAGVIIDGLIVQLAGEPTPYPANVHFGGNGQR